MSQKTEGSIIDRTQFLCSHNFTEDQFKKANLDWHLLEQIHVRHSSRVGELQTTASYISERLQAVPAVHSLNTRIKRGEHIIAKMIRKKLQRPELTFEISSYEELITDLIGIRALHLFKDEWRMIHDFIIAEWELHEQPIAYVRSGDPTALLNAFADAKFRVEEHPFGYRSIHYVIESRPAKRTELAELQIRTIFEEGWSEIDHRVRYPRQSDDPYLAEFLTIFNRLAGSADEMGTFIKSLSVYVIEQAHKLNARELEVAKKEEELKNAVKRLKISEEEKGKLEQKIDQLRTPRTFTQILGTPPGTVVIDGPFALAAEALKGIEIGPLSSFAVAKTVANIDLSPFSVPAVTRLSVCAKCGKSYSVTELMLSAQDLVCPTCRNKPPAAKRIRGK